MGSIGTPYARHGQWDGYDVLVIGSGMGGLATAVLLARYGDRRVLVLERHYTAGGFTHTFTRLGFEWDVGVHYIGADAAREDRLLGRLFAVVTPGVQWASLGPVYDRIVIQDRAIDFVAGREAWREALLRAFPDQQAGLDAYIRDVRAAARHSAAYFSLKALPQALSRVTQPLAARGFFRYADQTTAAVLARHITDPWLRGVLPGQYGDYGLPPARSSFAMQAMLTQHYWPGAVYPVGGASVFARQAERVLREHGGAVVVRAEVARVVLDARGRAIGVQLQNGHVIRARTIVSDAGFAATFTRLLPEEHPVRAQAQRVIERVGLSLAHLNLYVGLDRSAADLNLPRYNLWLYPSPDHDQNLARYLADPEAPFPLVFISFGSARDPSFQERYPNRATVQVITPARWSWFARWAQQPWNRRGEDYRALKARFAARLRAILEQAVPQVRGHIVHAELSTPVSTVTFTGHPRGAIYGLNPTPARFREPMLHPQTPIPGLYLTGVDVATPGVGGALVGGLLTASAILRRNLMRALLREP